MSLLLTLFLFTFFRISLGQNGFRLESSEICEFGPCRQVNSYGGCFTFNRTHVAKGQRDAIFICNSCANVDSDCFNTNIATAGYETVFKAGNVVDFVGSNWENRIQRVSVGGNSVLRTFYDRSDPIKAFTPSVQIFVSGGKKPSEDAYYPLDQFYPLYDVTFRIPESIDQVYPYGNCRGSLCQPLEKVGGFGMGIVNQYLIVDVPYWKDSEGGCWNGFPAFGGSFEFNRTLFNSSTKIDYSFFYYPPFTFSPGNTSGIAWIGSDYSYVGVGNPGSYAFLRKGGAISLCIRPTEEAFRISWKHATIGGTQTYRLHVSTDGNDLIYSATNTTFVEAQSPYYASEEVVVINFLGPDSDVPSPVLLDDISISFAELLNSKGLPINENFESPSLLGTLGINYYPAKRLFSFSRTSGIINSEFYVYPQRLLVNGKQVAFLRSIGTECGSIEMPEVVLPVGIYDLSFETGLGYFGYEANPMNTSATVIVQDLNGNFVLREIIYVNSSNQLQTMRFRFQSTSQSPSSQFRFIIRMSKSTCLIDNLEPKSVILIDDFQVNPVFPSIEVLNQEIPEEGGEIQIRVEDVVNQISSISTTSCANLDIISSTNSTLFTKVDPKESCKFVDSNGYLYDLTKIGAQLNMTRGLAQYFYNPCGGVNVDGCINSTLCQIYSTDSGPIVIDMHTAGTDTWWTEEDNRTSINFIGDSFNCGSYRVSRVTFVCNDTVEYPQFGVAPGSFAEEDPVHGCIYPFIVTLDCSKFRTLNPTPITIPQYEYTFRCFLRPGKGSSIITINAGSINITTLISYTPKPTDIILALPKNDEAPTILFNQVVRYFRDPNSVNPLVLSNSNISVTAFNVSATTNDTIKIDLESKEASAIFPKQLLDSIQSERTLSNSSLASVLVLDRFQEESRFSVNQIQFSSKIFGLSLVDFEGNKIVVNGSQLISITMPLTERVNGSVCLYWDEKKSLWSNEGIMIGNITESSIECLTYHLTNFTVGRVPPAITSPIIVLDKENNLTRFIPLIVILPVAFIVALIVVGVLVLKRKQKKELKSASSIELDVKEDNGRFQMEEKIGEDSFSEVFRALDSKTTMVSVKRLKKGGDEKYLLNEYKILGFLHHPNIVQLLELYKDESMRLCMVTEYASMGNLLPLLKNSSFTVHQKVQIALDVSAGLRYLEEKGIVHCDVSAKNILIKEGPTAKISNFGYAKSITDSQTSKSRKPNIWDAPEIKRGEAYGIKSDIWMFGIFLSELDNDGNLKESKSADQIPVEISGSNFEEVMKTCLKPDARERESFGSINSILKKNINFVSHKTEVIEHIQDEGQYVNETKTESKRLSYDHE